MLAHVTISRPSITAIIALTLRATWLVFGRELGGVGIGMLLLCLAGTVMVPCVPELMSGSRTRCCISLMRASLLSIGGIHAGHLGSSQMQEALRVASGRGSLNVTPSRASEWDSRHHPPVVTTLLNSQ
jgi:hypothetical protein